MSKYKGKIKNLKHLVASDPHYQKDVWCRYDKVFDNPTDWNVELIIEEKDYHEDYNGHDLHIQGTAFNMILKDTDKMLFSDIVKLKDLDIVSYYEPVKVESTEIGMDTAQVSLGTNELADEINKYAKDINDPKKDSMSLLNDYRPYFAMNTLTDGTFGTVREFYLKNNLLAISIDGWIDKDSGYSKEETLNYLTENLSIEELEVIKDIDKELG